MCNLIITRSSWQMEHDGGQRGSLFLRPRNYISGGDVEAASVISFGPRSSGIAGQGGQRSGRAQILTLGAFKVLPNSTPKSLPDSVVRNFARVPCYRLLDTLHRTTTPCALSSGHCGASHVGWRGGVFRLFFVIARLFFCPTCSASSTSRS